MMNEKPINKKCLKCKKSCKQLSNVDVYYCPQFVEYSENSTVSNMIQEDYSHFQQQSLFDEDFFKTDGKRKKSDK